MADPYQPINVSTGSAQQAIQSTPIVTPNLNNLMQGIASGFISVDDIRKRASDGPLEAATRNENLADVQQIRPLRREVAAAQLENIQAKEQFEAETLPILNDTKREQFQQDYQNVLQHGHPKAVMDLFNKTVPGWMPYDKAKLFPKEGGLNTAYALEVLGKALEKANAQKEQAGAKPFTITNVNPQGQKTTSEQHFTIAGKPVGAPIPTGVQEPNQVEAAQKQAQSAEGIRKEFHGNDTIQAFNKVDAAVNKIRLAATPTSTPFQDMSAIFAFMKVLDPGSTVREGEYATVEKSRGWPDAFRGLYNKALSGQKLTVEQKAQLLASGEQNYQGQLQNALPAIRQYADLEDEKGFGPGTIVPVEFREKLTQTTPAGTTSAVVTSTGAASVPVIDITDRNAAAAQAKALPPNVQFFKWAGSEDLYKNPNYLP